jgi:hypothetical protein
MQKAGKRPKKYCKRDFIGYLSIYINIRISGHLKDGYEG